MSMPAPTWNDAADYLGDNSWSPEEIESAFDSERAAQAHACNVPADGEEWPADLFNALMRRTSVNLAMKSLPLGVQVTLSDVGASAIRVGGADAEVRRLERPYRKLLVG